MMVPGPVPLDLWILAAALAWDEALGEPPARFHPVVWVGRIVTAIERRSHGRPLGEFLRGLALAILLPSACAALTAWCWHWAATSAPLAFLFGAFALKSAFALRALSDAGLHVAARLQANDLPGARTGLASLCSRDASALDAEAVAGGAVESVAENTSDSVVAPLFWFVLLGLPGVVFYRVVNTMDAMIGYRGRFEFLGKAAARLDDAMNFIPARITAALLLVAGGQSGYDAAEGLRVFRRDGGRTESPNAGRPMAAVAGLLGVRLEKAGHYALGDARVPVTSETIAAAVRLSRRASALAALCAALAIYWRSRG